MESVISAKLCLCR